MSDTLLLTAAKALKLDDDIALLKALGAVIANWVDLAKELDDYASAEALLNAILTDVNGDKIAAAFKKLGLEDELADLKRLLGRVADAANKVPPEVRALLSRLDSHAIGAAEGKVDWKLATSDDAVVKTERYSIDLGANIALTLDAGASWPGDSPPARRLKLSAEGGARAGAKAAAPYVELGASATAKLTLDYYFAAKPDELFALAVARRVGNLADPFDLKSVWTAFTTSDLDGMRYAFGGAASANLKVAFADAQVLSRGIKVDASFTIDVSTSLKSDYELTLRKTQGGVAVKLSRSRASEAAFGDQLKVGVDLSSITQPVTKAIERAVKKWDDALATIKPYLSPGTWLRGKAVELLTPRLTDLIQDPDLRAAAIADMKGALGLSTVSDVKIVEWLSSKITDAIDRASVLANDQVGTAVDRVAAHLTEAAPLLSGQWKAEDAKALIKDLIGDLEKDLKEKVQALLDAQGGALKTLLQNAGAQINGAVASIDDALKGVRDLLTRYDTVFHKILKAAQEAAKAKVTARLYREETRSSGSVVEVAGDFTGFDEPTAKVFAALTRGQLAYLERLVDGEETAPFFVLKAAESSVKRFSRFKSEEGLEIIFLNISFAATTKVEIDAEVLVDGLGQVHVDTAANLAKRLSLLNSREVSFVDSYRLVLAAAQLEAGGGGTSPLEVGVGAAFSDNKLSWKDVSTFIKDLDDARLVSPAAVNGIRAAFDRWSPGGGAIRGEISAALRVKGDAIGTLLRLTNRTAAGLPPADKAEIIAVAMAAALRRKAIDRQDFEHGLQLAYGEFKAHPTPPLRAEQVVLNYWDGIKTNCRAEGDGRPKDYPLPIVFFDVGAQEDYEYFVGQGYALRRIPDLIDTMGAIYLAKPSVGGGPGWSEEEYRKRQETLVNDSKAWLHVFSGASSLWSSKVTPRTVAFLRTLADLSGRTADSPGGLVLTLTWKPKDKPAQTVSFS